MAKWLRNDWNLFENVACQQSWIYVSRLKRILILMQFAFKTGARKASKKDFLIHSENLEVWKEDQEDKLIQLSKSRKTVLTPILW